MIGMVGPETLTIVAVVALVLFGGAKIPELARSLGRAQSEFRKGKQEGDQDSKDQSTDPSPTAPAE
jgi:TatA/E family protein of Tat protein translocase